MPIQLYVFETITLTGFRIVGTAGLPKSDMLSLMSFYSNAVTRIVPAPDCGSRVKVVTPLSKKS